MCKCAECQEHLVQTKEHSAQAVPSATLGTKHSYMVPLDSFLIHSDIYKTLGAKDLYRVLLEHSGQKKYLLNTHLTLSHKPTSNGELCQSVTHSAKRFNLCKGIHVHWTECQTIPSVSDVNTWQNYIF
jgi:hypothetical protein